MSPSRSPLIDDAWPRAGRQPARMAALILIGAVLLAASAKLNLPLPYVPMTLQTLVVLVIGAAYGRWLGAATVIIYLAIGACGLPVFAGPAGGWKPLTGATAGFLYGFVLAAFVVGWLTGGDRRAARVLAAMAIGHMLILALGWGWLAYGVGLGAAKAWIVGIAPFLAGAVVKTILGAVLVLLADRALTQRGN